MDFLGKIRKHLARNGDKEFRKQVLEEKKQKYLFSDELTHKYRSSRTGFFGSKRRTIAPFTTFILENFSRTKRQVIESHILTYMGIFLLILSGYIIFFSPYFRISPSHVLLEARNDGIDISVAYRAIEDIYDDSLFFLDEEKVALTLKKALQNLSYVTIDKLYPNGVKILMTSTPITYQTRIHWFEREWQMSDNGVLIPKTSWTSHTGNSDLKGMEVISESLRGELFFDYKQIIADENMLLINKIIELFEIEWKDIPIQKVRYFTQENELHIQLQSNTIILLTLESEFNKHSYSERVEKIKNQLLWLKVYIDHNKSSLLDSSVIYIDARIIKKVFICKEIEVCKNNLINIYGETYR